MWYDHLRWCRHYSCGSHVNEGLLTQVQPWDGPRRTSKRLRQLVDGQSEDADGIEDVPEASVPDMPRERHPQGTSEAIQIDCLTCCCDSSKFRSAEL